MDSSGQASSAKARWAFFLLMAGMVSAAFLYRPSGPSICTSKRLLNFACPGCGMMRSVCAMAQGRFVESVDFHLFGPLVFAVMLTLLGISVFNLVKKRGYRAPDSLSFNASLWVTLVMLIGYWAARTLSGNTP